MISDTWRGKDFWMWMKIHLYVRSNTFWWNFELKLGTQKGLILSHLWNFPKYDVKFIFCASYERVSCMWSQEIRRFQNSCHCLSFSQSLSICNLLSCDNKYMNFNLVIHSPRKAGMANLRNINQKLIFPNVLSPDLLKWRNE